jgi:uncharacterized protein with HEPN domain
MRSLRDIVSYGTAVATRLRSETLEAFASDADMHDSVYFRLLCVSEAVRHAMLLDPSLAERNPRIPWRAIRALGNVLRHDYGEIDAAIIWSTVARGDVDALVAVAQDELKRLEV